MLLNAANVVTAAERCHAIDEKTGRIPIQFLLSRSTDLDDATKDQLQQLAVTSPTISILPDPAHSRCASHAPPVRSLAEEDAVMTDVNADAFEGNDHGEEEEDDHKGHDEGQGEEQGDAEDRVAAADAEEEALKEIDRESGGRGDRHLLRVRNGGWGKQKLTRKAIRKHAGMGSVRKKVGGGRDAEGALSVTGETSSTRETVGTVSSSASGRSNTPRRRWKEWEDELLVQVVGEYGPTRWNQLARHFPGRNGRQVRLRWMNHLQPSLDKRPWRPEEDEVLLEAHRALGNKWALISMRLGGRTDNSVKNRYKSIMRRNAREAKGGRKAE